MSNDSKVSPSPVTASAPQKAAKTPEQIEADQKREAAAIGSSWGDRFKKAAFGGVVDVAINYFINTLVSVAMAYRFEMKWKDQLRNTADKFGVSVAKYTGLKAHKISNGLFMGTRGLTLTMGGTMLIPVIKYAKDHRHKFEFELGHGLDVAQNTLGFGNAATEENLREYKTISKALAKHKTPDVSQEDLDRFKTQHCVTTNDKGKFDFIERKPSWLKAIAARGLAWAAALGTNSSLGYMFDLETQLKKVSPSVTPKIASRIPIYNRLKNPNLFTENLLNDMILTVSSSVTQATADRVMDREKKPAPPKKTNGHSPVAPASQPADADMQWARQKTQQTIASAIKASESHTAQVADSRTREGQSSTIS